MGNHLLLNGNDPSRTIEPLWTIEDAARFLRLNPSTVRAMARQGKIPSIKVGRNWRFQKSSLAEWLAKNSYDSSVKENL